MSHPNILWIVLDACRADRVGCYGYHRDTSPNIDRLAAEGLRCDIAIAQGGYSLPSYATMFSGLYPSEHCVNDLSDTLGDDVPVIQELIKPLGYATAAIGGNGFFNDHFNLIRGFDVSHYHHPLSYRPEQGLAPRRGLTLRARALRWLGYFGLIDHGMAHVCGLTRRYIAEHQSRPWLCFVHTMETHDPYVPPLGARLAMRDHWYALPTGPLAARHVSKAPRLRHSSPQAWHAHELLYDAEIRYSDAVLGGFLDRLKREGHLDNTLVVICADHGDFMGERDHLRHGAGLGEGISRVPLILWGPEYVSPGSVETQVVELRDIPHTLAALLDIEGLHVGERPAANLLGTPRVPEGRLGFAERRARAELRDMPHLWLGPNNANDRTQRLARDRAWEYIEYDNGECNLFKVSEDPRETTNLCEAEPERAAKLHEELVAIASTLQPRTTQVRDGDMPDEVQERLRDLGYL